MHFVIFGNFPEMRFFNSSFRILGFVLFNSYWYWNLLNVLLSIDMCGLWPTVCALIAKFWILAANVFCCYLIFVAVNCCSMMKLCWFSLSFVLIAEWWSAMCRNVFTLFITTLVQLSSCSIIIISKTTLVHFHLIP